MSDALGPRRVVRVNRFSLDPAIDFANDETNLMLYQLTRDESRLRFRASVEPTRFVLTRLSHKFATLVLDQVVNVSERLELAFRAACVGVEIPGEESLAPDPAKCVEYRTGVRVAGEQWVDAIADRFGVATVKEMGQVAWDMTQLAPGQDGPFVWPPGSALNR